MSHLYHFKSASLGSQHLHGINRVSSSSFSSPANPDPSCYRQDLVVRFALCLELPRQEPTFCNTCGTALESTAAHQREPFEVVSLWSSRRAGSSGCVERFTRRPQRRWHQRRQLNQGAACEAKFGASGRIGNRSLGSRLKTQPNPSLKLSPNSVAHWPSSAGPSAHFALAVQRATLSVPA